MITAGTGNGRIYPPGGSLFSGGRFLPFLLPAVFQEKLT